MLNQRFVADARSGQLEKMETLPPEMILQIAGNLSGPDLVALSGTSRGFSNMLSHERRLWKERLDELKFPGARYCGIPILSEKRHLLNQ